METELSRNLYLFSRWGRLKQGRWDRRVLAVRKWNTEKVDLQDAGRHVADQIGLCSSMAFWIGSVKLQVVTAARLPILMHIERIGNQGEPRKSTQC
jgi:hypothetical protein